MTDEQELQIAFETHRPRLLRVAYATLGSSPKRRTAYRRRGCACGASSGPSSIRDLGAWLTTTVSRLALDVLGSAQARRERYVGPWLPEPLVEEVSAPADRVTLDESVSMALLVVLERRWPAERTAFLLHNVFGLTFEQVAGVVGRSPAAVRQFATRARRHVAEDGRASHPRTRSSGAWWTRSWTPARGVISRALSGSSTPTWCGTVTAAARCRPSCRWHAARRRWPAR